MTFEELAKVVADDFKETMKEEGFNTFNEMSRCYAWESEDIKEEVAYIINSVGAYIDEVDGTEVLLNDEIINYRKFATMWRKLI